MRSAKIISVILCCIAISGSYAQDVSTQAKAFISTLSPELKAKTVFSLNGEERFNLNFVPKERQGPTFHDFNDNQKAAALALLRASLSQQGYDKAIAIPELEKVLIIVEKQSPESHYRDPLNYHFCIFGDPSSSTPWGWRFEGHHISLNFASSDGRIVSGTPAFMGSNPSIVSTEEQRGKQVLKMESELGLKLINSMNPDQMKVARVSEQTPREIITGNNRKATNLEPRGIGFNSLNSGQQKIFLDLLDVYVKNYELGFSKTLMDKIKKAGLENLSFAWAGNLTYGLPHYYRIQGPMLLIEYDNIQTNANHVHTIVRDLTNDFAEDILKEHYIKDHKN